MPIAHDCLIALGPKHKDAELLPDQVDFFNALQVRVGHDYVYYRPGSDLRDFVLDHLRSADRES